MDVVCRICGEPWDLDTFHEVADEKGTSFNAAYADFRRRGCVATGWTAKCSAADRDDPMPGIAGELMDLLGDDVDGAAAMLEDFGLV